VSELPGSHATHEPGALQLLCSTFPEYQFKPFLRHRPEKASIFHNCPSRRHLPGQPQGGCAQIEIPQSTQPGKAARQMVLPLDTTLLQRNCNTPQQQGLSAIERRSNLRNAFTLTAEATSLRILLIDDVMTTGETVRECCRTLLAGGVEEVQVAVVGRA
jgi:hypothetical protein